MKKRLAKKIEKMRRKKIHEALEMVLEINTTQARSQELTGRKPTAFFWFSGHVADVDVIVYQNGGALHAARKDVGVLKPSSTTLEIWSDC